MCMEKFEDSPIIYGTVSLLFVCLPVPLTG